MPVTTLEWRLLTRGDQSQIEPPGLAARLDDFVGENYEHTTGGKLPRNHLKRAYRLTCADRLLAIAGIQHSRMKNCVEVRLFAVDGAPPVGPQAATREWLRFVFSDAVRTSGRTELHFMQSRGLEPARIPVEVMDLAERDGIALDAASGVISEETGAFLWMVLTGFSAAAQHAIRRLEREHGVPTARICYIVNSDCWSLAEMETILLGCSHPEFLLSGGQDAFHGGHFALEAARAAILGGALDRYIAAKAASPVQILVERDGFGKIYRGATLPAISWTNDAQPFQPGESLRVLVRTKLEWSSEFAATDEGHAAVLYPADFHWLPNTQKAQWLQEAGEAGVTLLAAPDTVAQITIEARRRLALARMVRT